MYQVTAIYQGSEVGYGEGDSYEYAANEAAESVPSIYPEDDVILTCSSGIMTVETPLSIWREFA